MTARVPFSPPLGALCGAAIGACDFALFRWLGLGEGPYAVPLLAGIFVLNLAALGYAAGHLYQGRRRARADAAVIRAQLAALQDSGRAVLQAEKLAALGRVAAGIAHEVRNPLSVIRASASLIEEDLTTAATDARRACRYIVEESDRLDHLVGALLSFARPARPCARAFRLDAAVARALRLFSPALRKDLAVTEDIADDLPELSGDPDLLQQVLLGLLVNAAEAGARTVTLRAGCAQDHVWLDVRDDGPGVPAEHAATIFEPFFTTKQTGTGLGLPTAARIAEAHGGTLALLPSGPGACFRLRLPQPPQGGAP